MVAQRDTHKHLLGARYTTAGPALELEQEFPSATQASTQKDPWITGQWAEATWSYMSPAADVTALPVESSVSPSSSTSTLP